ncbi:MAG TPA: LON peptidase substrate-binding domain-containing protein, partial [Chloroflexia bacterium]|nr:LON peptidase substrate-binding domain-containing protein [Chloroflexia bacterium]
MPKKKQPNITDTTLDEIVSSIPTGNGHDHDYDGSVELDEPVEAPTPRPRRRTKVQAQPQQPEEAAEDSTPAKPGRSRSGRQKDDPEGGNDNIIRLPLLPLRDMVVFPHMVTSLFVGREKSIKAIEAALNSDRIVFAVAQRQAEEEEVTPDNLYTMGVELVIGRSLKMPDGTISLLVQGQRRVRLLRYLRMDPYIRVMGEGIEDQAEKTSTTEALMRAVLALFEKVVKLSRNLSDESYVAAMNVDEPGWLADLIASTITLEQEDRQKLLETIDPIERLSELSVMLA